MENVKEFHRLRVRTTEAFAHALNEARIEYSILSGLDGYPDRVGRDLDVLISSKNARQALEYADQVGRQLGWDGVLLRKVDRDVWPWQIFLVKNEDDGLLWLGIDLIQERTLFMGAAPFYADFAKVVRSPDFYVGPFPVSKIGHFAKAQLRRICYGYTERFRTKTVLDQVEDPDISNYLHEILGSRYAECYISRVRQGAEALPGIGKALKWAMNRKFLVRHPLQWTWNVFWTRVVRYWELYWKSSGLVFAVVWPEGQRDAHALDEAESYFDGCFDSRRAQFPGKAAWERNAADAGAKPGWLMRWWNALVWLVRLTVTYYGRDRILPDSVIQFVIYDGSPRDVLRHPRRYGMTGGRETKWLSRLAPWPVEVQAWRSNESGDRPAIDKAQASGSGDTEWKAIGVQQPFIRLSGKEIAREMIKAMEQIFAIQNSAPRSRSETTE